MDSREDEQVRGITMKSSAISLRYTKGKELGPLTQVPVVDYHQIRPKKRCVSSIRVVKIGRIGQILFSLFPPTKCNTKYYWSGWVGIFA